MLKFCTWLVLLISGLGSSIGTWLFFFPSFVNSNFDGNRVFGREVRKTLSRSEKALGSDFCRVGERIHSGGEQKRSQHMIKMQGRDK